MINLILRFYDPKEGEILLDGRQLTTLKLRDVRREIGTAPLLFPSPHSWQD
jgi:ABC-type multidrug transport system fused ATPase/permease subunit